MSKEKILIVDDEEDIVELIKFNLESLGYTVFTAYNGSDAASAAKSERPDLVLLDWMLPEKDGLEVCKEIKANKELDGTGIIMLTAKNEELDKILGLELGADDYVTKPFSVRELISRIKAVLRRVTASEMENNKKYEFHDLSVNYETHEVMLYGKRVELSLKEFELLKVLIQNKGKIMTRGLLLDKVWGYNYVGESRTVDVHVRYLRKKLEDENGKCNYIETIRGVGYRFIAV